MEHENEIVQRLEKISGQVQEVIDKIDTAEQRKVNWDGIVRRVYAYVAEDAYVSSQRTMVK